VPVTRHYFTFTMVDGSVVELMTDDSADAEKVLTHRWTTNASTYFTPWMTPAVSAGHRDPVPGREMASRVNLSHVASMGHWRSDR
jgi:hypothetical protein